MKLHELGPVPGSKKGPKRLGRGTGSGHGKTSGKGHKGQNARSGGGVRPGFEGGQMPLYRRIGKRGFTNRFKKEFSLVNVASLNQFEDGTEVTPELLIESRLASNAKDGIKVLGNGDLTKKLTVRAHRFSETAAAKINAAGGSAEVI